uniref:Copia protein n=1 Tax=Cajanus cajan TaxID=3821 RepID=A0A151T5M4_CAJCA|nr:Copia protein [Cajanus cajan]
MQGFTTIQTISPNEKFVFMGNRVKVPVEAVGTYRLILNIARHLDLLETLYVPSLSRNLDSLSKLDGIGYSFGNGCFSLFKHNYLIGTDILCDGLYKLNLDGLYDETLLILHHNFGTKRSLVNERSAFLWHRCLGHISRERMERLIKKKLLQKRGICAQYTMPDTPQQNSVSEKRNRTLMDMVRSMLSNSTLPIYLWMYALKTAMYLLNRVPSKTVSTTPFELWTSRTPSLRHLHIWVVRHSKNDKYSKGAKHMELKYFAVKEEVQKQRVSIEHISTNLMIADPLTKGLPPKTFIEHVKNMGIIVTNDC